MKLWSAADAGELGKALNTLGLRTAMGAIPGAAHGTAEPQ
jgi:hypothetical protein